MSEREQLLAVLAADVLGLAERAIVAVDGVDGAGKTTFADELAAVVRRGGRPVARASVDRFHRHAVARYRRGRRSPDGFYLDSYDYDRVISLLLEPFASGDRYVTAIHDVETDRDLDVPAVAPRVGEVLVVDGIFLHRPELRGRWAWSAFLRVPFELSIRRCADRDGSDPDAASPANRRYVEGQRRYLRECSPELHATVVVDNSVLGRPTVVPDRDRLGT